MSSDRIRVVIRVVIRQIAHRNQRTKPLRAPDASIASGLSVERSTRCSAPVRLWPGTFVVMANDERFISHSVIIDAAAEELYDMLADLTRMGEWSRACTGATWDEGWGPSAIEGAWFTGHNLLGDDPYDAHCQIVEAVRPTTIAWMQGGTDKGVAEWRYRLTPVEDGTEVTESWTLVRPLPPDIVDDDLAAAMRVGFDKGIRDTLDRLKHNIEGA